MKDKEARRDIDDLGELVRANKERIWKLEHNSLSGVEVRYCPTCKHETMQQQHSNIYMGLAVKPPPYYDWDCLTCGSKIVCETVCKPIKDK